MRTLRVELGARSYPIYIGKRLIDNPDCFLGAVRGRQVLLVSNETVAPLYLDLVRRHFAGADFMVAEHIMDDGEAHKNLQQFEGIVTTLLRHDFNRDCCLFAIGGGVVGDTVGFAAACYQRGVDFIQVPTTLMAQVDSSVGGKTAVNHPLGKNMIGAFHQPLAVVADIGLLTSLPEREYRAGLAEVIKYGLIRDSAFFSWLEEHRVSLLQREQEALMHAVERSCLNKAAVVSADEHEAGVRATLNLGHTFGHALETALAYRDWLHGEAVACGLLLASRVSVARGWLAATDGTRIATLLQDFGLPTRLPAHIGVDELLALMRRDKKARGGRIVLVLLDAIGSARIDDACPEALLQECLSGS